MNCGDCGIKCPLDDHMNIPIKLKLPPQKIAIQIVIAIKLLTIIFWPDHPPSMMLVHSVQEFYCYHQHCLHKAFSTCSVLTVFYEFTRGRSHVDGHTLASTLNMSGVEWTVGVGNTFLTSLI